MGLHVDFGLKYMKLIQNKIDALKKDRNAVILAHYYQRPEVQEVADVIGDSLHLSLAAQRSTADVILFAGVRFMAETAKILNPERIVLMPDTEASCSLVEQSPVHAYTEFIDKHPGHAVVTYINSDVAIKALSDWICTSSNAEQIIAQIPAEVPILFGPDMHLGDYLKRKTGRDMVLWQGVCEVHDTFDLKKILGLKALHPDAMIIAHPECSFAVLEQAQVVGSTSLLISYVAEHPDHKYIVATEVGVFREMQRRAPHVQLIPAPPRHHTECACGECPHMKRNTLEAVAAALETLSPQVEIPLELRLRALQPLERMLALGTTPVASK